MEGLKEFLALPIISSGHGDGSGSGSGYGDGSGSGYGSVYGYCSGYGSGSGYGSVYGSGSGYGSVYGSGSGDGSGYGDGSGSGLNSYDNHNIYFIDGTQTIITSVKGFIAKGYVIRNDLTTKPVYIARVGNSFAHGKSITEAQFDAENKHLIESPVDERIDLFLETFKDTEFINAKDLYRWHFNLTGSCSFGRDEFVIMKGISIDEDKFSIDQFISLTINQYGGNVIKKLKERLEVN